MFERRSAAIGGEGVGLAEPGPLEALAAVGLLIVAPVIGGAIDAGLQALNVMDPFLFLILGLATGLHLCFARLAANAERRLALRAARQGEGSGPTAGGSAAAAIGVPTAA